MTSARLDLDHDLAVEVLGAPAEHFEIEVDVTPVAAYAVSSAVGGASDAWEITVRATHRGEMHQSARIRASVSLPGAEDPWWLVPGLFYGENRPAANERAFPRFERGAHGPEAAASMVSDTWDFRADRAATPAVFAWRSPGAGGMALAADAMSALGLNGIGFAHDDETARAELRLTFPFCEAPITYYGDADPRPPEAAEHVWEPGERAELRFRAYRLPADRHAYAPLLRSLRAEATSRSPIEPWADLESAADVAAEGLTRWHYDPDPGILLETIGFDREVSGRDGHRVDRQAMHVGWVSGLPWAHALLRFGIRREDEEATAAARHVIDFITSELSPSGTFWGVWYREHGWSQSWTSIEGGLHSRTLAEASLFLLRSLRLEQGREQWQHALASNLDTIVRRQRPDGNLGSIHHAVTGEVLSWSGASGLMWVAALAEAADLDPRYLPAAIRAGDYYSAFVRREFIHGAPEDVDLAPTSEDGYVAIMAYAALYRSTGESRWLSLARSAADWMLTFRYSYNVEFGPATLLGRYGFATRGGDQASPSNQHLHAYGLVCTRELHELSEWLDDDYYRECADDALACFRQLLPLRDGDVNAYRGMITERYYQTSCFQPPGMLLTLSHAWSAGVLLLGCEDAIALGSAP